MYHYRGYNIISRPGSGGSCVVVEGVRDFDPVNIFECGQCFRWYRESDGSYTGVVSGRVANVSYSDGRLVLDNVSFDDFIGFWFDYFDLGRDYGQIKKAVATDDIMKKAVEFGSGIRLLRQEAWEVVISFIISANNRIPRIMKIINEISRICGKEIEYRGQKYYGFPDAQALAECGIEQIKECRAGYRCDYIHETARAVVRGEFNPEWLFSLDKEEAKSRLLKLKGVGNKVADCILLYSGARYDVFPTDVWVKRVMEELYFGREAGFKEIQRFAAEKFGMYAGFAQQYLFYYAREHKIGV